MTFNVLLTGVGGEGVLITSVIVARAAAIEGYKISGTQLHGLAQRGGSIPTHVRFGKEAYSPIIPRGQADLILGLEPVESARSCYFATKQRTNFVVDTYPLVPVYTSLHGQKYPTTEQIRKMIEPFAKKVIMADTSHICEQKLGNPIYGNVMAIGVALANGFLPLSKKSVLEAIKNSVRHGLDKNMEAFRMGMEYRD
ncbi:MAG: indolepyruvate oxidoreductase subunit beta [Candidatus Aenigmarchaeota archaeon]|nr:indolepyruvate oxidoreductase subunit beta [Candidatus Aenigmarchaeota archaeon]